MKMTCTCYMEQTRWIPVKKTNHICVSNRMTAMTIKVLTGMNTLNKGSDRPEGFSIKAAVLANEQNKQN